MRKTCLEMIYKLAKDDSRILFIGSDVGSGTLDNFRKEMPDRFFMEGICEAGIIGMSAGLALDGSIPYVHTIATFLTRRCFEQIVLDLCLHNVNVRLIGSGGGLVYAPLGPTHEATEDIAILRAIPNMTILAPADATEVARMMPKTVDHKGPIYIRLAKGGDPIVTSDDVPFEIGKVYKIRDGSDAMIISTGVTLKPALDAATDLEKKGINVSVLHVPTIKPLDSTALLEMCREVPIIVTVEEHTIIGGLGSAVAEVIAEGDLSGSISFKRLGIPDVFPERYGNQASLMNHYNISREAIENEILRLTTLNKAR